MRAFDSLHFQVRGEAAYEDQHAVTGLSSTAILDHVNVSWLSTSYVVDLFDRYMRTYKGTNWSDGYVIPNAFIDDHETMDKWQITREPLLIQVFSNYWLLMDGKVLPMNNIYIVLCMWLSAIRKTRRNACVPADCLADNTYIGDIIDRILLGKGDTTHVTENAADAAHLEQLRRGLDVAVTRMRI